MEELFENKTKYTKEQYNTFMQVHQSEYIVEEIAYMLFNILFFGLTMILAFRSKEIILGIAIVIGLIVYIWYKFIWSQKRVKKNTENGKLSGDFVNTYKFYKRYFGVENQEGNAQILYFKIYRVVETKDNYYIYITRNNAFIVSKNGFTKGDNIEFSKFIKGKTITRYKNRIRRSQAK